MTTRIISRWLLLCALGAGAAAVSPVYGQYMYSVVEPSGTEIYSASVLDVSLYDYADYAYVYAELSDPNGNNLDWGYDQEGSWNDYDAYAEVDLEGEVNLTGYFSVYAENYEWYLPIEGWLYLGPTTAGTYVYSGGGGAPNISHIDPPSGTYGQGDGWGASGGYIQIYGSNLDRDGATCLPWVSFGSCYWASDDGTQVNLYYDGSTPPGTYPIEIELEDGVYSNQTTFTINGDPTPSISSINPSTWQAGTTVSFTISGSGFGTNPTVQYSCCSDGVSYSTLSDSEIDGTIAVDPSSPAGTLTVMVSSNGYNGYNFQPGQQGQSNQATAQVTVQTVPAPRIRFNGNDVTGMTEQVYIGEQINLTWQNNGGPGTNLTWTIPGSFIAGTNPSTSSGFNVNNNVNMANPTFYWLTPGSYDVYLSLTLPGTAINFRVSAHFNVQAPSPQFTSSVQGPSAIQVDEQCLDANNNPALGIHFGGCNSAPGAAWSVVPDGSSPGGYEWEQVVFSKLITADGAAIPGLNCTPSIAGTDNAYPYSLLNSADDSPRLIGLDQNVNIYTISESFQMTLLYNPDPGNNAVSTIYVPLFSVNWYWTADVTGNGWSSQNIVLQATANSSQSGEFPPYPAWTGVCSNN